MRKVIVLKGISGSGKSTYIKRYIKKYLGINPYLDKEKNLSICSADNYFVRPDGIYDWNPRLLAQAHHWCFFQFELALINQKRLIFIDNTNIRKKDYQEYIDLAKIYRYKIKEVIIGEFTDEAVELYASRNQHKVPYSTIKKQRDNFEF